jgi:hypothetical protein
MPVDENTKEYTELKSFTAETGIEVDFKVIFHFFLFFKNI